MKKSQTEFTWPYPIKWGEEQRVDTDILILGGGIAGFMLAIGTAGLIAKYAGMDGESLKTLIKNLIISLNIVYWNYMKFFFF